MTTRRNIMLGTAGHVDHGKTALVKLLTGCETDTLAEEKERGLTIDLGFAPCRLSDQRVVGIVDVPGHVDFIRNMVAGAHGIDVVIFVVAADDGIMPQTHEHMHILTLMGVRHGLVALTKIDLVEPERRDSVVAELRALLASTFLAAAPICPVSSITGEGFDGFYEALNREVAKCEDRASKGLFRMWVDDAFTIRGSGTVVTGIPTSGTVRPEDRLRLLPAGDEVRVRRMQVYGVNATEGRAGECVALNLPELNHESVRRGMVLCEGDASALVTMAEAELRTLDWLSDPLADYVEVHLHIGTASVLAHVAALEQKEILPGSQQMVQLRWHDPLPLTPGERFVLRANLPASNRSGLATVGGGRILGTDNVRLRRNKPWALAKLAARRQAVDDPLHWVELIVREQEKPVTLADLQVQCRLKPEQALSMMGALCANGCLVRTPAGTFLHASVIQNAVEGILSTLTSFHGANPQRAGIGREELAQAVPVDPTVLSLALESLIGSRQLELEGTFYRLPGHGARLSDPEQMLRDKLASVFRKAGWAGPTLAELAASLGAPPPRIQKAVRLLHEQSVLVQVSEGQFVHREAIEAAQQVLLRLFARAPSFTTMDFRDALGVSRKYAVPLLDFFDRMRWTVRSGNVRTPGTEARKVLK